jgi:hypothetical protein
MPNLTENLKPPERFELTAAMEFDLAAGVPGADPAAPVLPRFSMVAYTGGLMRVAQWRYPVVVDFSGLAIPSQNRPIRVGHNPDRLVGHSSTIAIESGRLVAAGVLSIPGADTDKVVAGARNGFPWQASIGTRVEKYDFIKEGQTVLVNGRQFTGPVNVVRRSTLGEISFVDIGADGNTSANVAAAAKENDTMTDTATTTQTAQDTTATAPAATAASDAPAAAQPAQAPAAPPVQAAAVPADGTMVADPVARMRIEAAAELDRIGAIRKLCGEDHPDICAKAIRDNWDVKDTELAILRDRPEAPNVQVPDNNVTGTVLEAAAALTARMDGIEKVYDEKTLDVAAKNFRGGIGLQELLLQAAWANGYTGRTFRDTRAILRAAFYGEPYADPYGDVRGEGGFSTVDMSGILSNLANKFLLKGFFSVERTWRNICAVRSVKDFKTAHSYRLIGVDQYQPVAPGGELKHGTLGNETYTNKADTYGLILSVDRRDIINDDLGAITTVPQKLGRGSGLKINDVFWTIFLNNATFFTAAANNYISGASSVLSIDGLTAAETMFLNQVDAQGKPIGIMPSIILVPTGLSAMATQLFKALEIRDTTANTKYPVANPHTGKFRSEVSRYMGNTQYTGSSTTAWYLLADPEDLALIEVAFLNGQESPTIETALADFDHLGLKLRGYHDFGVALQDGRAGVKNAGA